jgi:hypothetical protein
VTPCSIPVACAREEVADLLTSGRAARREVAGAREAFWPTECGWRLSEKERTLKIILFLAPSGGEKSAPVAVEKARRVGREKRSFSA